MIAALVLLAAAGCDQKILECGMAVDNRTGQDLTVYALVEMQDGSVERSTLGTVAAGQRMGLSQPGCSPTGLKAETGDGTVVATVPPRDPSVDECDVRWVITRARQLDRAAVTERNPYCGRLPTGSGSAHSSRA